MSLPTVRAKVRVKRGIPVATVPHSHQETAVRMLQGGSIRGALTRIRLITKTVIRIRTNRTRNRTQNAQPSRQHSQDSYSVDEQFMNAGGEAMDDFC